jgi:hypothetical protein
VLGWDRAAIPRKGIVRAAVVNQCQPLPLVILEIERQSPVALHDIAGCDALLVEPLFPPIQRFLPRDPQCGPHDRACSAPLGRHRPVEKSQVRARASLRIRVEEVVRRNIILVDRPLDEAHAHGLCVEVVVIANPGRDRGQVMNASEFHVASGMHQAGPFPRDPGSVRAQH